MEKQLVIKLIESRLDQLAGIEVVKEYIALQNELKFLVKGTDHEQKQSQQKRVGREYSGLGYSVEKYTKLINAYFKAHKGKQPATNIFAAAMKSEKLPKKFGRIFQSHLYATLHKMSEQGLLVKGKIEGKGQGVKDGLLAYEVAKKR